MQSRKLSDKRIQYSKEGHKRNQNHIISNLQDTIQNYQTCEEIRTCDQCSNKRQSIKTNPKMTQILKLAKILKQFFKYTQHYKGKYAQVNK